MRISDWSSDVCSSDLFANTHVQNDLLDPGNFHDVLVAELLHHRFRDSLVIDSFQPRCIFISHRWSPRTSRPRGPSRSEEQTSELQSLMRISYAVFCLKKKN